MNFDEKQVRKTIGIMKPNNQSFEVRIKYKEKNVHSGYFNDVDILIKELEKLPNKDCNVYMTLNRLHEACMSRTQSNEFIKRTEAQTSDNDVKGYEWLLVDLDPCRPTDTSSSDEELEKSKKKAEKVYYFMSQLGFSKPLIGMSGNGYHLLYKIKLKNSDENKSLIKTCLEVLDMFFSDDDVKIDKSVCNQSRVCKLYGTAAQKGKSTTKRPHRLSYIYGNEINTVNETDVGYLKKLCSLAPQEEKPQRYNNYNAKDFDIVEWMNRYGLQYRTASWNGGTKYVLNYCPFDSSHKSPDSAIFKSSNGSIGFKCLHNSCSDKTWKDVRIMFEPDAYEKKYQEREQQMFKTFNRNKPKESKPIVVEENKPLFYTAQNILDIPKAQETFIRTGYIEMDKKLRGLKKGFVGVVSGLRGSSKSTMLSQISLNAINDGNNVAFFSGELAPKNFMNWMNQQAAGRSRVEPSPYGDYYNVPAKYQKQIAEWMGDKLWLYNNEYGFDSKAILDEFEKAIVEKKLDLLILDNLMAFDLTTLNGDKWDAQKEFVWKIHTLAQKYDVAILFVAHPRKAMGFLRLDDISGSSDIANAVEYAFIVHRNNNDFKRLTKQMFGWNDDNKIYTGSNIIEICKDRDGGTQDYFIPLHYEVESKRLKNDLSENVIYGWDNESDGFLQLDMEEEVPFG